MRQVDRVLHDINLVIERRRDVHRGIRDDEGIRMVRHVHDEAMTDAACCSDARLPRHHGSHQFVGVQATLHQRLDTAGCHQFDRLRSGIMAMFRCDELHSADAEAASICDAADAVWRPDQHRFDQPQPRRFHGPLQRHIVARMRNRHLDGALCLRGLDQALVLFVRMPRRVVPKGQAWAGSDLLLGSRLTSKSASTCASRRLPSPESVSRAARAR